MTVLSRYLNMAKNSAYIPWKLNINLNQYNHGSNTSSSEKFLNQVKPIYSIIMVGKDNTYGLPKNKILERLANYGSKIYRTDEIGTIKITSDGNKIEVHENTWQFAIIKLKYNR